MCRKKWNHVARIGKSTNKSAIVVTSCAEKEAVIDRDIIFPPLMRTKVTQDSVLLSPGVLCDIVNVFCELKLAWSQRAELATG